MPLTHSNRKAGRQTDWDYSDFELFERIKAVLDRQCNGQANESIDLVTLKISISSEENQQGKSSSTLEKNETNA